MLAQTLLAVRRSELRMTQAELAKELGCTTSTISKWEAGQSYPALRYRDRLAQMLDVRPQILFGDVEKFVEKAA